MIGKRIRCVIVALALIASAAITTAQVSEQALQSTLLWVYPQADGSVILTFAQDSVCSSAGNPKYYTVVVGQFGMTADGVKNILATALTAFALGRPLSVVFDDSTAYCYINRIAMM